MRWVGLLLRKTALYFAAGEIPNNVDFYTDGVAVSPLLAALPLRFGFLSSVGLAGMLLMLGSRRAISEGGWIIGVSVLVFMLSAVFFHVVSRFRVPIYGPMSILSGYALARLIQVLRDGHAINVIKITGLLLILALIVSILPWIAERTLARPVVQGLPEDIAAVSAGIGSDFEIVGYKYPAAVEPGEPTFVNLYIRSTSAWAEDIYATVQLFNQSGDKIAQVDQPLGTGSFPDYPTSQWVPGEVVWDQFLLFPPKDIETPIGLDVLVAIYDRESGERIGDAWLAPIALTNRLELELPTRAEGVNARVGPALLRAGNTNFPRAS